jgi:imidazolonepropionase-like amidohydrolase
LLTQAILAMDAGLPHDEALRAITLSPAEILGLDDRIGSLRVGLDADVVLWSGDPMAIESRPETVLVNGEVVFTRDANGNDGVLTERFAPVDERGHLHG